MKKKILMILAIILIAMSLLFINQKSVRAAEVTAEKVVTSTNGTVDYIIKGLELEQGASYQWAIEKSPTATITNWYDVSAPNYTTGEVRVSILSTNETQLEILKSTDTAYITIRKSNDTSNVLSSYKVDLTLPLLKSYVLEKSIWYDRKTLGNPAYKVTGVYGIRGNISFKWEKITDSNIVNNYIDNNHDLSGLKLKGRESFPSLSDTSWKSVVKSIAGEYQILNREIPEEDGLYYIWLQGSAEGTKTIYGQTVVEVGKVTKIEKNSETENNNGKDSNVETSSGGTNNKTGIEASKINTVSDSTTATKILPNTGKKVMLVVILSMLVIISLIIYRKCKEYRDIK